MVNWCHKLKKSKKGLKYLGIDNARRMEVIGSSIIVGAIVYQSNVRNLTIIGVDDSKKLGKTKVDELGKIFKKSFEHKVYRITPKKISSSRFAHFNLVFINSFPE